MTRPDLLTAATITCYTLAVAGLIWLLVFFLTPTPARSAPPAPDGLAADRTVDRTSRSAARVALPSQGSPAHPGSPRPRLLRMQTGTSGTPADFSHQGKVQESAGLGSVMRCIRARESGDRYDAVSPDGQYRGAFQLSVQWSGEWAARYDRPAWSGLTADHWPRAVQDHVALGLFRDWPGAFSTYAGCA